MRPRLHAPLLAAALLAGCRGGRGPERSAAPTPKSTRPSILLVTLDTTRADAIGPEATGVSTPAFDDLAGRGLLFHHAYATVPETLPSHASMMTGLYPAAHGVHENARPLSPEHSLLAERLRATGYRTAAFVSAFALARRFGLSRGFDLYDDALPTGLAERSSRETTERAIAYLRRETARPLFLWVHYYDPHAPYAPPEPFRTRYAKRPYLGEVAAMDEQMGKLLEAFEEAAPGPTAIAVVGDHGEGLGDHGESQHGKLLYQATMRVPLVIVGPGVVPGVNDAPASTRRIFHTVLDWAGLESALSLRRGGETEVVLGEAMKPFLAYGWQPQVMAVEGPRKAILAGRREVYDVVADPGEARNIVSETEVARSMQTALTDYPVPSVGKAPPAEKLDEDARRKLATLGYVGAGSRPVVRKDAPRPADMVSLFDVLDEASNLFVREEYGKAVPFLQKILAADPHNLDAALRLATAHSQLGRAADAEAAFARAKALAPDSEDVRTYLALHYARGREWERAAPLLERVVAESPDRLPALEALAVVRERQGRVEDAISLRRRIYTLREPKTTELVKLGQMAMSLGQTTTALEAFEKARALDGATFRNDLELGVLYLAARRLAEARDALDRVPPSSPGYAMALFKRAQVSVLLREGDQAARIDKARRGADATTRELIAKERLFAGR